jgi:ABC-2 type transport system permease protein
MMFLLMVRVDDPLVPRAMFGVLNVLLFYPSGAMYPIAHFPLASRHRHRRPLHLLHSRLQSRLLKDGGFVAIQYDLALSSLSSASARCSSPRRSSSARVHVF